MSEHTRLYGPQTAEPGTCGSCKLFKRLRSDPAYPQYAEENGTCNIKFPPWVKLLHHNAQTDKAGTEIVENSTDWTRVRDNDTCTFWRSSGLTFVKDHVWLA